MFLVWACHRPMPSLGLPVVSRVEFHSHHFMKSDSEYRTPRTAPGASFTMADMEP